LVGIINSVDLVRQHFEDRARTGVHWWQVQLGLSVPSQQRSRPPWHPHSPPCHEQHPWPIGLSSEARHESTIAAPPGADFLIDRVSDRNDVARPNRAMEKTGITSNRDIALTTRFRPRLELARLSQLPGSVYLFCCCQAPRLDITSRCQPRAVIGKSQSSGLAIVGRACTFGEVAVIRGGNKCRG
jgi:hypothetical protein